MLEKNNHHLEYISGTFIYASQEVKIFMIIGCNEIKKLFRFKLKHI